MSQRNDIPPKLAAIPAMSRDGIKDDSVESYKVVESTAKLERKIVPKLDYSSPENFVTYGSAEEYYVSSIENIYKSYPYDGSKNEKVEWSLTASGLDQYVFDNEYPRRNGHVSISHNGWSSPAASSVDGGNYWYLPTDIEYIFVPGGPNTDSTANNLASLFPSNGGTANVIDASESREANLTFGPQNTVEFWMKKDAFVSNPSNTGECIFDMWKTGSLYPDDDYGKMQVKIASNSGGILAVVFFSGSSRSNSEFTSLSELSDGNWHHYAMVSDFAQETVDLYIDGVHREQDTMSTTIGVVTGHFNATIGSLYEAAQDSPPHTIMTPNVPGWNKMSGSLDEFRFWKTARSAQEVGLNYNTQVYGGTNTDTANTDLGVYYKFNEGIMGTSKDAVVLDYSGRISNGTWIGYTSGARSLSSAMVESGKAATEFKDPIIYETHPDVVSLKSEKSSLGLSYDQQNNASLYNSMPMWIREEDSQQQNILKLTQVMSSYLDALQNSVSEVNAIKNLSYPSGSELASPIARRNLQNLGFETEDFFIDATVLEKFMDKNNTGDLEYKLSEIKNLIYQNIYNNLSYIASSKGTEKSFRNLARCFGIDERLLKLKIYSNNEEYKLEDKYAAIAIKKNMVDLNDPARFDATMFQTSSTNSPTRDYIPEGVSSELRDLNGFTLEGEIILPAKPASYSTHYFDTPFAKSSAFGFKYTDGTDLTWHSGPDISINVVREQLNSAAAYFQLSSSYFNIDLTSSVFPDAYDGNRWNLAAKLKNNSLKDGSDGEYVLEFQGVNSNGSRIENSFSLSHSFTSSADGLEMLVSNRRIYAGAKRTDTIGSVVDKSDVVLSAVRYWQKYLDDDTITSHAIDATSHGIKDPSLPLFADVVPGQEVLAMETLVMDWGFETVSSADASGNFFVPDLSSGSADRAGVFGEVGYFHPAKGYGFPANDTAINEEYINTLARVNPENSNGSDMVRVLTPAQEIQEELSSPTNLVFSVEKSLYQTISDEMIKFFSTSADLASLYMKPSDKYNTQNQELSLIRGLFFEKMQNTPDVNKFYNYFKWIDDAIVAMLRQQLPAGTDVIGGSINTIESHVLERNKIKHKPPTYATSKSPVYEGALTTPNTERIK